MTFAFEKKMVFFSRLVLCSSVQLSCLPFWSPLTPKSQHAICRASSSRLVPDNELTIFFFSRSLHIDVVDRTDKQYGISDGRFEGQSDWINQMNQFAGNSMNINYLGRIEIVIECFAFAGLFTSFPPFIECVQQISAHCFMFHTKN